MVEQPELDIYAIATATTRFREALLKEWANIGVEDIAVEEPSYELRLELRITTTDAVSASLVALTGAFFAALQMGHAATLIEENTPTQGDLITAGVPLDEVQAVSLALGGGVGRLYTFIDKRREDFSLDIVTVEQGSIHFFLRPRGRKRRSRSKSDQDRLSKVVAIVANVFAILGITVNSVLVVPHASAGVSPQQQTYTVECMSPHTRALERITVAVPPRTGLTITATCPDGPQITVAGGPPR